MYDKNFQEVSSGKMELFSSFFSAIKSFIKELVLEGSTELKNIELGDYAVMISSIPNIQADLVLIADKEDQKLVNKLIPKLIKILLKHKEIFSDWNGDRNIFAILDQPLSESIISKKKLIGESSLLENPEEVLKSMWAHKGELAPQTIQGLTQERDFLISRLEKMRNVVRKQVIAEKIVEISEQLKDEAGFIEHQKNLKNLKDQVKDTKIKLKYYLERIKEALSKSVDDLGNRRLIEGDYKDAYLHLYSFSSKLKLVTTGTEHEKYRHLANLLINKSEVEDHQLSEAISEVLRMNDDIEQYIEY